jgi:hypothetical protein
VFFKARTGFPKKRIKKIRIESCSYYEPEPWQQAKKYRAFNFLKFSELFFSVLYTVIINQRISMQKLQQIAYGIKKFLVADSGKTR